MATVERPRPIRAGIFDTVQEAAQAIDDLKRAGFTRGEINVVCSDESRANQFREYVDQKPAGARTGRALNRAGLLYMCLAVVALIGVGIVLTYSLTVAYIILGVCLGISLLSVLGSAMMTRGSERELSDYYSQAVEPGKLLVAVDLPDDAPPEKLAAADRIFSSEAEARTALPHEA